MRPSSLKHIRVIGALLSLGSGGGASRSPLLVGLQELGGRLVQIRVFLSAKPSDSAAVVPSPSPVVRLPLWQSEAAHGLVVLTEPDVAGAQIEQLFSCSLFWGLSVCDDFLGPRLFVLLLAARVARVQASFIHKIKFKNKVILHLKKKLHKKGLV